MAIAGSSVGSMATCRVAVVLLYVLWSGLAEGCALSYVRQPVSEFTCNPSNQSVQLECEVTSTSGEQFELRWKAMTVEGVLETMMETETLSSSGTGTTLVLSTEDLATLVEVFCELQVSPPIASNVLYLWNVSSLPSCNNSNLSLVNSTPHCIETTPTTPPTDLYRYVLYIIAAVVLLFAVLIAILAIAVVILFHKKCHKKRSLDENRELRETKRSQHGGFSNRLSTEKRSNVTVTFSESLDSSDKVSPTLVSGPTHKTCLSGPCPPTPEDPVKLDLVDPPTSHFLNIYRTLRDGADYPGTDGGSEEGATPTSSGMQSSPFSGGVCNPVYVSSPHMAPDGQETAVLEEGDSAYVRSRYEWSEPSSLVEGVSCDRELAEAGHSRYRGDYERDPLYMAHHGKTYINQVPGEGGKSSPPVVCGRSDKYRGDYERSDDYTFPPASSHAPQALSCDPPGLSLDSPEIQDSCVQAGIGTGRYRGNYERSQAYVQHLLKTEVLLPSSSHSRTEHVQLLCSASS